MGLSAYERANRERYLASGGKQGLPILMDGQCDGPKVFWSRGWENGCPICHRSHTKDIRLVWFTRRDGDITTSGWRCR